MPSSQGKPKPSWRTHSLNPFKNKSQEQLQPIHDEKTSQPLPINAVYYPNWRVYKGFPPSSLNLKHVTHVFYAFAWWVICSHLSHLTKEGCRVRSQGHLFVGNLQTWLFRLRFTRLQFSDEYADSEIDINGDGSVKGCLNDLRSLKKTYPNIKTVLSVGGGEGSAPFAAIASNGMIRSSFAQSARQIVEAFGFDGIDRKPSHGNLRSYRS